MKYEKVESAELAGLFLVRVAAPEHDWETHKEGDFYMLMCWDDYGDDFTGPLTAEQVVAFHTLFETFSRNPETRK